MKQTLTILSLILGTFAVAFVISLLLELQVFQHWVRQVLVYLLMGVVLTIGTLLVLNYAKTLKTIEK